MASKQAKEGRRGEEEEEEEQIDRRGGWRRGAEERGSLKKEELLHPDLGRYWRRFFVCLLCLFVCCSVGRLVGCLVGWLVGWSFPSSFVRVRCVVILRGLLFTCVVVRVGLLCWFALLFVRCCVCARVFCVALLYESPGGNQVDGLPPALHLYSQPPIKFMVPSQFLSKLSYFSG